LLQLIMFLSPVIGLVLFLFNLLPNFNWSDDT
jgi:hypothetical protein